MFGVPAKPDAPHAGTLTATAGTAISTPATASFLTWLRTLDDIVQVIDHSLHRVDLSPETRTLRLLMVVVWPKRHRLLVVYRGAELDDPERDPIVHSFSRVNSWAV